MSKYERIEMIGISGRVWALSGEGVTGPVMMAPGSTGLYETAVETKYTPAAYGEVFEGVRYPSTTFVWTAEIGADKARHPLVWESIYSDFRADLSFEKPVTIRYISSDGVRTRNVRLQSEPKPFSTFNFEGGDPRLFTFGSMVLTMKTELPFYVGTSVRYDWAEPDLAGDTFFTVTISNPGSVEIWPKWVCTDQAQWILPDSSFGSDAYGNAEAHLGRTVPFPLLAKGEGMTVNSHPDERPVRAENDAPLLARCTDDLIYPVPPGVKADFTVRVRNCTNPDGAAMRLELPRWYLNPFSRPRITV